MDNNIILHFSENVKFLILDLGYILNKVKGVDISNISEITLSIDNINDDAIKDFMRNNKFRINGVPVIKELSSYSSGSLFTSKINNNIGSFVSLMEFETFDFAEDSNSYMTFNINVAYNEKKITLKVYIDNIKGRSFKLYNRQCSPIGSNMESFMLLRTNPKLTGNIKLVATSDNKLFIDTFKVSSTSILNMKQFRHQPVGDNGDYPRDVYSVFKNLPSGELYSIYNDSYDPHKNYYDMNQQIENIYEYGADFNNDNLYSENLKILAPLYIGKHLPTYFVIFRTDRLQTYSSINSDSEEFNRMLSEGTAIKVYDLRISSPIGKYLHGYQNLVKNYISGNVNMQFIEQDTDKKSVNYRQGRNTWRGISVDSGILVEKMETSYFATKILEDDAQVQENYDMYILDGYQRNNILYPNILNMEFMFDDKEAEDMSIHGYFGLYMTENEFINFNQIVNVTKDGNQYMTYYDGNGEEVDINDTKLSILDNEEYENRIFMASSPYASDVIDDVDMFDVFVKNNVLNKPYKNVVQIRGERFKFSECDKSFISTEITKPIEYGEHFRYIIRDVKNEQGEIEDIVLDIIASNDRRLIKTKDNVNPFISTNMCHCEGFNKVKIYRMSFYTPTLDGDMFTADTIENQMNRLRKCIDKFYGFIRVSDMSDNTISVVSPYDNVYFQHILAEEYNEVSDIYDYIRNFNYNNDVPLYKLCNDIDNYKDNKDIAYLFNVGLELTGCRYMSLTKFIRTSMYDGKYVYLVEKDLYDDLKEIRVPLISSDKGYIPMLKHEIHEMYIETDTMEMKDENEYISSIVSPYDCRYSIIVSESESATMNNGMINICSPIPCSVSLMGINSIKDIDMYVDSTSKVECSTKKKVSFKQGETVVLDNSDDRLHTFIAYRLISGSIKNMPISASTVFFITNDMIYYTDEGSVDKEKFKDIKMTSETIEFSVDTDIELYDSLNIENYSYIVDKATLSTENYYIDFFNSTTSLLQIPFVPMINCQWRSNGVYFDNDSVINAKTFSDYAHVGNFIENEYSPSEGACNQYTLSNLDDVIHYTIDGKSYTSTIRDMILNNRYPNFIKKILVTSAKIDTAIGYYNPYIQSVSFIYYGISFTIKFSNPQYENDIQLNEFSNFEVYIINDYNASSVNEIFINKDDEFMLFVNHNYRFGSSYSTENIKMLANGTVTNAEYDWFDAPYNYNLLDTALVNNRVYLSKTQSDIFDTKGIKYVIEDDVPDYDNEFFPHENPIMAYFRVTDNKGETIIDSSERYDSLPYTDDKGNVSNHLIITSEDNNLNNEIDNFIKLYTNNYDYRKKNTYILKDTISEDNGSDENLYKDKLTKYVESFNDCDIELYIIGGDDNNEDTYKKITINENYKPLNIVLSLPNKIKFNQGIFDPNFVDVVEFSTNDSISDILDIDTLYANTHVTKVNKLPNYYYNKIMNNDSQCTYNYFADTNRSVMTTCWDNNIYRLYEDDSKYSRVKGYTTGITDKTFFGSICLNMHDNKVVIDKWNYVGGDNKSSYVMSKSNVHSEPHKMFQMTLNVTKTFYNHMSANTAFTANWDGMSNVQKSTYINNFISNTLISLFDFNGGIDIELYRVYSTEVVKDNERFIQSEKMFEDMELCKNIETEIAEINNEIVVNIKVSDYENYRYYPIVNIRKF